MEYSKFCDVFVEGSDFVLRDDVFLELLKLARNASSPGLPLMYNRKTNKDVKDYPVEMKAMLEKRIRTLVRSDLPDVATVKGDYVDPSVAVDLVDDGVCDPVRLLNKNEPTRAGKTTRNIASVSLVDSMVDVIVDYAQLQAEIQLVADCYASGLHWPHPSTIGIDLATPANLAHMLKRFQIRQEREEQRGSTMADSDLQGFEYCWSVACHKAYAAWRRAKALTSLRPPEEWWWKLFRARNWCLMHPLLATSRGTLFTLRIAIMLSGRRTTAHGNSVVRSLLPSIVDVVCTGRYTRLLPSDVNGDDANEATAGKDRSSIEAGYKSLGFKLTDLNIHVKGTPIEVHFCSWIWRERNPQPEGYGKALMKLLDKREVLSLAEYLQFHERYVETGVVSFPVLFPFIRTLLPEDALQCLHTGGHIGRPDLEHCLGLCSTPAEWKTNGKHTEERRGEGASEAGCESGRPSRD